MHADPASFLFPAQAAFAGGCSQLAYELRGEPQAIAAKLGHSRSLKSQPL